MKPVLSVITLLVGIGVAIGGTFAVFTDTETTTGSTFTAGTVDIAVDGQNPWTSSYEVSLGTQTALKPSQTGYITFDVSNVGDNPVHVWKKVSSVTDDGGIDSYSCPPPVNAGVSSEPECKREIELLGVVDNISTKIIYDLSILPQGEVTPVVLIADGGTSGVLDPADESLAEREGVWIYLGVMDPADIMEVKQSYHLDKNAENEYQGDTSTFNIDMFAGQVEGAAVNPCLAPLVGTPAVGDEVTCP